MRTAGQIIFFLYYCHYIFAQFLGFTPMWHNLYAKFYTVSQPICCMYNVNSFCSWYWAGVGSSKEEDGRFGGRSILCLSLIFSAPAYFLVYLQSRSVSFRKRIRNQQRWNIKVWSRRLLLRSGPVFSPDPYSEFPTEIYLKKLYNKKMATFALILIINCTGLTVQVRWTRTSKVQRIGLFSDELFSDPV